MKARWPVGLLLFLAAIPAQAQQLDSRWTPWLGCWQLVDESVGEVNPAVARRAARPNDTRVCVVPAGQAAGVTLSTVIEDQSVLQQTIVADGAQHPIDEADCRGWQRADWSRTGERLFSHAELTCTDEEPRKVSGLAQIAGGAWIDIQAIEIAGREHIRVRRYRRAADQKGSADASAASQAASIAPRLGATKFTLEDVKEAAAVLSPRAVEAALVETNAGFDLTSKALIDLDDAGVPDSVIDLMVALSYPRRFVVDRARTETASVSSSYGSLGPYSLSYDSLLYDAFWDSPYVPYYYSPFGYAYWAGYGVPYYPYTGFMTLDREDPAGGQDPGTGRLVNGAGYTRIRPREPEPAESRVGSGSRQTSDGGSAADWRGTSSGDSSAGVSSGGFSSGGSSTDTGRTAQPR